MDSIARVFVDVEFDLLVIHSSHEQCEPEIPIQMHCVFGERKSKGDGEYIPRHSSEAMAQGYAAYQI
jgi:hypothetical protein